MKKLLLALALMPALQAEPASQINAIPQVQEAENKALIAFTAKFKALHSFSIAEYTAIQNLFTECADSYYATHDLLIAMDQSGNPDLKAKAQELNNMLIAAGTQIAHVLNKIKEVNQEMIRFNALTLEDSNYQEMTNILLGIAQDLYALRDALETIKTFEQELYAQALELSQTADVQAQ